jgi:hypothetical protein
MYLEMAAEEDKIAEAFGRKAGKRTPTGFSSLCIPIFRCHAQLTDSSPTGIDWSILCCRRVVDLGVNTGHPTEPTGHL